MDFLGGLHCAISLYTRSPCTDMASAWHTSLSPPQPRGPARHVSPSHRLRRRDAWALCRFRLALRWVAVAAGAGRHLQQLLAGLRGPYDLRSLVPVLCLQGAALKPLQESLAVFGAEGDLLESCQQALFHYALHPYTRQYESRVESDKDNPSCNLLNP